MLVIGRIGKAHGLRGEVTVTLTTNRLERLDEGAELATARGPLRVASSRPHQDRFLVFFDGITTREEAEELRGHELLAEPIDDPDELWVHELIGSTVFDSEGTDHGMVVEVLENPASDLLQLESGTLVPVRFIVEFSPGARIVVDAPDGIFDPAAAVVSDETTG